MVVTVENGGCSDTALFEDDLEEREAIKAIDGEAALSIQCGKFVGLGEPSIPCDGRVIHQRCHDAYFGFERQARAPDDRQKSYRRSLVRYVVNEQRPAKNCTE